MRDEIQEQEQEIAYFYSKKDAGEKGAREINLGITLVNGRVFYATDSCDANDPIALALCGQNGAQIIHKCLASIVSKDEKNDRAIAYTKNQSVEDYIVDKEDVSEQIALNSKFNSEKVYFYSKKAAQELGESLITLVGGKTFYATHSCDANDPAARALYGWKDAQTVHTCLARNVEGEQRNDIARGVAYGRENEKEFKMSETFNTLQVTALRDSPLENSNPKPK